MISSTNFLILGERIMAKLRTRSHQLPEQVSSDPRLGWLVQQSEGTHQLGCCNETFTVLQGKSLKYPILSAFDVVSI